MLLLNLQLCVFKFPSGVGFMYNIQKRNTSPHYPQGGPSPAAAEVNRTFVCRSWPYITGFHPPVETLSFSVLKNILLWCHWIYMQDLGIQLQGSATFLFVHRGKFWQSRSQPCVFWPWLYTLTTIINSQVKTKQKSPTPPPSSLRFCHLTPFLGMSLTKLLVYNVIDKLVYVRQLLPLIPPQINKACAFIKAVGRPRYDPNPIPVKLSRAMAEGPFSRMRA